MPTKEMLIVLNTLDTIKRKGSLFRSQANNLGYVTFEEIQVFQQIAQREGALSQIAAALLNILEKTEDHPDLPGELASVAGLFLAWSLHVQAVTGEPIHCWRQGSRPILVKDWFIWVRS